MTGHSYIVYGPLANGATTLMFEGVPTYPSISRFWEVIDKHKVNIFYTAPTAIRSLMAAGEEPVKKTSRKSLRCSARSASRSIRRPGNGITASSATARCPIVDTWWQTETGGILISPLPGATAQARLGDAPFFGVAARVVDRRQVLDGPARAISCIADSWPGQMRTVYGDHERFVDTYFAAYPGKYFTGDGCRRDGDGYYWITGRVDDVINVSGHRMGTAEVESALVAHRKCLEAAVVGYPHDIKGQGIYGYVTLMAGNAVGRDAQGTGRLGPQGDRADRLAGHLQFAPAYRRRARARSCADPAQDRRERVRQPRRHLTLPIPRGRRFDRETQGQSVGGPQPRGPSPRLAIAISRRR